VKRTAWLSLLAASLATPGPGCAPTPASSAAPGDTLTIGGYSVIREAFGEALLPAFRALWKARTGRDVAFVESYKSSGAQSRDIQAGFEADVAVLSLEDDVDKLVKKGLVEPGWKAGPGRGIVTHSLVVIGHRAGNPRGIKGWDDLARPGIAVIYPDPNTSGGARWNVNALYGHALLKAKEAGGGTPDPKAVGAFLKRVQANVVNMDSSGRMSVATFERGTGDVLVTYENELLLRRKQGRAIPYVIPDRTLLIESPAAVVDANVEKHGNRALAEAFLAFLRAPEGQKILTDYGFRPVDPKLPGPAGTPPPPAKLFTMADLGGWGAVKAAVYGRKGLWTAVFIDLAGGK